MLASLSLVIILGMLSNALFVRLKLPGLLGMLMTGILLGPFVLNRIDPTLMLVSSDLRMIALIIILLRAGLGISRRDLHKVGKSALLMSFVPGIFEGLTIAFSAMWLFDMSFIEGGILGFVIAAVSPAVVVPQMIRYAEEKRGTAKGIPTLILASASVDDVFAITLFSAFLGLYSGAHLPLGIELAKIPVSIMLGIGLGVVMAWIMVHIFDRFEMRDSKKVIYLLGAAMLLITLETALKTRVDIAALLGVMTIGFVLFEKRPLVAKALAKKYAKIWIFAELLLFVLVGSQVNIHVALASGLKGLLIIFIGLCARSLGVYLSLLGSDFTFREKVFCMVAYMPKATVQAAIGGVPLAMGVLSGDMILAIAVLSILVTAPLGAMLIHYLGRKWLSIDV